MRFSTIYSADLIQFQLLITCSIVISFSHVLIYHVTKSFLKSYLAKKIKHYVMKSFFSSLITSILSAKSSETFSFILLSFLLTYKLSAKRMDVLNVSYLNLTTDITCLNLFYINLILKNVSSILNPNYCTLSYWQRN